MALKPPASKHNVCIYAWKCLFLPLFRPQHLSQYCIKGHNKRRSYTNERLRGSPADAVLQERVTDINLPACGSADVVIVFMWVRGGAGFCKCSSFQTDPQPSEWAMAIVPKLLCDAFEGKRNRERQFLQLSKRLIQVTSSLMCRSGRRVQIKIPSQSPALYPSCQLLILGTNLFGWLDPAEYIKWLRNQGPGSDLKPAQKTHLVKRFSDIKLFSNDAPFGERH